MRLVCEGSFTTESAAEQDYATSGLSPMDGNAIRMRNNEYRLLL